ncbi:MAG: tRNA uracil 4-sulfurtransferase ThiI [Candidatus Asgardarchaeia archaeon]
MSEFYDRVIVRYGEIGIKSKVTRKRMEKLLIENIKRVLEANRIDYDRLEREWGRIFIVTKEAKNCSMVLSKVMGIVSSSPVRTVSSDLPSLIDEIVYYAKSRMKDGMKFALRVRRVGSHSYSSQDVARIGGAKVLEELKSRNISVDLKNPDFEIFVEIRGERAYIYHEVIKGPGGLPLGSEGKAVCLFSGGIDSSVAVYMLMRRGVIPILLFFDRYPFSTKEVREGIKQFAKKFKEYSSGVKIKLYIVPHGFDLAEILKNCERKYTCLVCRRLMFIKAQKIAELEGADAIVTGEMVGEQASQTLKNIRALSYGIEYPIIRPVIAMNKDETIRISREIGMYDISTEASTCCTAVPRKPATRADKEEVLSNENRLDVESIVKTDLENMEVYEF